MAIWVISAPGGRPVWATNTAGPGREHTILGLSGEGTIDIRQYLQDIWAVPSLSRSFEQRVALGLVFVVFVQGGLHYSASTLTVIVSPTHRREAIEVRYDGAGFIAAGMTRGRWRRSRTGRHRSPTSTCARGPGILAVIGVTRPGCLQAS